MSEITNVDKDLTHLDGLLPSVLSELTRYQENHRLLLVVSCSFAELMVGTVIEEFCKQGKEINDSSRDFPFSVRVTLLYELGLISEAEHQQLNWLRNAEMKLHTSLVSDSERSICPIGLMSTMTLPRSCIASASISLAYFGTTG